MKPRKGIPIESPGINLAVVKKEAGGWQLLMLRRAEGETYPGYWGLLTGSREGEETVPQLACRELAEETGLVPESLWASEYCVHFYEPTVDKLWILPVIVAVVAPEAEVRLSAENSQYQWASIPAAAKLAVWKNLVTVIGNLAPELEAFPAPNWVRLPVD
jgi:dATP pyrophosphohydrolase